ncbi:MULTISPECIES: hypothetical protein [Vibrio]|uniref:hypothetical protein n=1 Tax=Vibrio TaxID=662 RepID=UPI002964216A|nr:hypothetical protein [Vibrio sp. 947]MDW1925167.1 hypothetical protein [Vibrio sp. 947]
MWLKFDVKIPKTIVVFFIKCTGALLTVFSTILMSRYMGDEFLGEYSLSLTVASLLSVIICFGQNVPIMNYAVNSEGNRISGIYHSYLICFFVFIIFSPISIVLLSTISSELAPVFFSLLIILSLMPLKTPLLTVKGKYLTNAIIDDFIRPLYLLVFVILIYHNDKNLTLNQSIVSLSYMSFGLLLTLFLIIYVIKSLSPFNIMEGVKVSLIIKSVKMGAGALLITVAQLATSQFDRFFIGFSLSVSEVGVYFKAQTIVFLINYFVQSIILRINPQLVKLNNNKNYSSLAKVTRKYSFFSFLFSLLVASFLFLFMPVIESVFDVTEPDFSKSIYILILAQAASMVFGFGSTIMLYSNGKERTRLLMFLVFSFLVASLCWVVLIPLYGITGAALGTSIAYIMNRFLPSLYYRKKGIRVGLI